MKFAAALLAAFALCCSLPQDAFAQPGPVVAVDGGRIRGVEHGGGALFRGIPFAAPPLEGRRWKPPEPVIGWKGVRDTTKQPPSCVQNDQGWNRADFISGREDCLTLDVRTPALSGRRPVLVWIHGGSNRAGGPNDIVLSDVGRDIVIVGVRYRLGIFGFLSHRGLTAKQGGSGNYGLMDQVAALQWVQRNVARFGGDPNNVTIAGESAGAQDVGLLLAAPAARSLFGKAILESGTPGFGLPFRSLQEAHRLGDQADALLGTGGDVEKMRSMSVPALLAVDKQLHDDTLEADDYLWLRTTTDGKLFVQSPRETLVGGPPRPVVIGSNRFELDLPGGRPHRDAFVAKAFGPREAQARAFYRLDQPEPQADPRRGTRDQQIATDLTFRCPAANLAKLLASHGAPVWQYEFDAAPGGGMTRHALEIGYAFGDLTFGPGLSLKPYWLNFVKTGDPNGAGLPNWPRQVAAAPAQVRFSDEGVTMLGPERSEICSLLDRI
jgi:para-nitrobenzyl esterase